MVIVGCGIFASFECVVSSKYNSTASLRFFSAFALVFPWLATPSSGQ